MSVVYIAVVKFLFFLLALIKFIPLNGQTPCNDSVGNWHFESGNTYIEFVITDSTLTDSTTTISLIREMLLQFASNIQVDGNRITAEVKNFSFSDKDCGFVYLTTDYLFSSQVSFNVTVQVKSLRYKVMCSNFTTIMTMYGTTSSANWNTVIYKKNGCLKSSVKTEFEQANCQLKKMTTISQNKVNDW